MSDGIIKKIQLPNGNTYDIQSEAVIDLGYVDAEEYDYDIEAFLNTLLESGEYRLIWGDGDDFEYFVVVESLMEDGNGFVYHKYWYTEEGSQSMYHRSSRYEDGELVDSYTDNYLTLNEANSMFASSSHAHYESASKAKSVWDFCNSSDLSFNNAKPFLIYKDTLNDKNWLIERYLSLSRPANRLIRVTALGDASVIYQRSGIYDTGTITWGDWEIYPSNGVTGVLVNNSSVVNNGIASITISDVGLSNDYSDLDNLPTIPSKTSDLNNDSGFITGYTETDPTVPSWAKASSKPSYTAAEVGAVPTTRTVNGKALSADITLSASDVSALPSSTVIPSRTSDITNDSGFITSPNVMYCTCDTAAETAAKVATIVSGTLTELHAGDQAIVKFTNTNTASNPTLNIAGTGAKAIKRYGTTAPGTTNATSWTAGTTFICVYDGTNWALVSWINTAYSEISEANITSGSSSSTGLVSGRRVKKAVEAFAPVTSVNGQTGAVTIGSDVFYAEYNVTSFQDVKDAYDAGKTIITFDSGSGTTFYYPLCAYADTGGTEGFAFEKIDADCYYTRLILLDTDVWSTIDGYLPYNNLDGTPTNLSDFNNDSGFIAEDSNGNVDITNAYKSGGAFIGSFIKVCGASNTTTLSTLPKKIEMHTKLEGKGNAFSLDGSFSINCEYGGTLQVSGNVRVGSNYSAQDIVLMSIYVNSTEVYIHRYRVPPNMTTPAQDITLPMIPLTVSASDKITLEVVNGTGARGTIIDNECKLYAMYIAPTLS